MDSPLPRKRRNLTVRRGVQGDQIHYRFQHPEIPESIRLEEQSYIVLSLLDGNRTLPDILQEVRKRYGIDITLAALRSFVAGLEKAGLLEPEPGAVDAIADKYRTRGQALLEAGDSDGALGMIRRSLEIKPSNSAALFDLGTLLMLNEQYSESLQCFEELLQKHPKDRLFQIYAKQVRIGALKNKSIYVYRTAHLTFFDDRPPSPSSFFEESFDQGEKVLEQVSSLCGRTIEKTALVRLRSSWALPYIEFFPHNLQALITLRRGHVRSPLFAHECVHLAIQNYNRFFAEGLAIYCQYEWFDRQPWPFPEGPLTRLLAAYPGPFLPLEILVLESNDYPRYFSRKPPFYVRNARQYISLLCTFMGRRGIFCDKILAYLEAGGFVKYLIETHGADSFRETFDRLDDPYQAYRFQEVFSSTYGKELAALEADWLKWVKGHRP